MAERKKITVPVTFSIYPPRNGGQERLFHLYRNISKKYNVDFVTYCSDKKATTEIDKNLYEIKTPISEDHLKAYWKFQADYKAPVADICMITMGGFTLEYGEDLKNSIETSDLVILSHPYLFKEVKKYIGDKPFIYEAQDVEYIVKKDILKKDTNADVLLKQIYDIEYECCVKSKYILTCSEEDKKYIEDIYKTNSDKIIVVPNGVDTEKTKYTSLSKRLSLKKSLGIENEKIALFIGSEHPPNIYACNAIAKIAKETPHTNYLFMGGICHHFINNNIKLPDNIGLLGMVDDSAKQRIFDIVDVALNPISAGSGTNLKMFDYMSAGIPVITTLFGSRGIDNKDMFIVSELDTMANAINIFDLNQSLDIIINARKYVEEFFDWKNIASSVMPYIDSII